MKKLIVSIIISIFVFAMTISVYAAETTLKSVDAILSEIRQEQGVQTTDRINPNKVSQARLEELGDSVMEAVIGNTAMHEQMDIHLGGEGSASLKAFHIRLGYNYLAGYPNGMMSLMSGGMIRYLGWSGIIIGIIVLGLVIIVLFFVVKAFIRKPLRSSIDIPLDILKKRYASGELKQEEYKRMTEQLRK